MHAFSMDTVQKGQPLCGGCGLEQHRQPAKGTEKGGGSQPCSRGTGSWGQSGKPLCQLHAAGGKALYAGCGQSTAGQQRKCRGAYGRQNAGQPQQAQDNGKKQDKSGNHQAGPSGG